MPQSSTTQKPQNHRISPDSSETKAEAELPRCHDTVTPTLGQEQLCSRELQLTPGCSTVHPAVHTACLHIHPSVRPTSPPHLDQSWSPPPYLGEQCGPLQSGLHQLVQGLEEPLQRALELGRLLPLVEPATAKGYPVPPPLPPLPTLSRVPKGHSSIVLNSPRDGDVITFSHLCWKPRAGEALIAQRGGGAPSLQTPKPALCQNVASLPFKVAIGSFCFQIHLSHFW